MSTIVVVQKNGQACIAGDSLTTFGETRQSAEFVSDWDKIIRFGDNQHIGIVGSAAHHLVILNIIENHIDKVDFSSRFAIFETMKKLHPILKDEYFLNSKDEDDDSYESSQVDALIMNSSGIYGLYSLREVEQYTKYWALGSGSDFALGAMKMAYDSMGSAVDIALAGVDAGSCFDTGSSLPASHYTMEITL